MWRNSSHLIDHVSVSFLWTKKINKDFYLWKKFGLLLFLTDKFLYPCVSFVSLSLLSLSMLLFENLDCRFHVFIDWPYTTSISRLSLYRHNACVQLVQKSCFYIQNCNLFFLFQVIQWCDMLYLDCYCISCRELRVGRRFLWWRSWLVKNLSTLMGYMTILYWWDTTPHGFTTHLGGILWMLKYPK